MNDATMPLDARAEVAAYLQQHETKSLLRFITCGSVDDGKSTLIGRLLHDTRLLLDDQVAALEQHPLAVRGPFKPNKSLPIWVCAFHVSYPHELHDVTQEVHSYVMARLPHAEPALAMAGSTPGEGDREKSWGIIEID